MRLCDMRKARAGVRARVFIIPDALIENINAPGALKGDSPTSLRVDEAFKR